MSAYDRPRCGARRPGWDRPAAGRFHRLPCVLAEGHVQAGVREHRDVFAQRWYATDVLESALGVDLAAEYLRDAYEETAR